MNSVGEENGELQWTTCSGVIKEPFSITNMNNMWSLYCVKAYIDIVIFQWFGWLTQTDSVLPCHFFGGRPCPSVKAYQLLFWIGCLLCLAVQIEWMLYACRPAVMSVWIIPWLCTSVENLERVSAWRRIHPLCVLSYMLSNDSKIEFRINLSLKQVCRKFLELGKKKKKHDWANSKGHED